MFSLLVHFNTFTKYVVIRNKPDAQAGGGDPS